ncbi:MAG: endopeptidase La [Prevotella sp.]|uniref:endopeptidase La n=1 Tax=Prevotella sp. Rep29 TaxID=2691580 RepID=UPI001B730462|nr:endopeptidase La [Prevotella sp. Rep29]MBP3835305.1 endopeptidase La [Prevotella sp.]MBR3389742.1 endopeptidase La [Prevotella sp.]MBR3446007.1 endopeptidase La [Prevotella sp.]QYR10432.1 endopeptidase La [Prevotella sp. Rep29]
MNKEKNNTFQMIVDYEGDVNNLFKIEPPEETPILATRNMVLFPGIISPILVGRANSLNLINYLQQHENVVFAIFCQRDANIDHPISSDLFEYGVYAKLLKVLDMPGPGKNVTVIVQGLGRCQLHELKRTRPYLVGRTSLAVEAFPEPNDAEYAAAVEDLNKTTIEYVHENEEIPDESQFAITNISNPIVSVNFVCANMPFSIRDKVKLLEFSSMKERVFGVLKVLNKELQLLRLKQNIRSKTREDIDEQQREYFLQQQIKNIKEELGNGEGSPERMELLEKAKGKKWSEEVEKVFHKELEKLDMLHPQGPEYSVQMNYLQTMVDLPWGEYTEDDLNIKRAERILNRDHYGMEKVKERILEYMAVLALRGDLKSPILCLYGPPGVGKTSLGKSIASAMNRKYVRVSLGGLHDESEIRGHRRTYVGAMPGRIIKSIQKAGSSNPVFILDEIDKVTQNTIHGDPASALLEVLDPEQNNAFHDNYLDVDYDLSKVMFIATANDLNTIPRPLLDRMEIIEVSGYITEEKIEIAKRHLIPRELENTGLNQLKEKPSFNKGAIEKIIEQYTRESGVRLLEKQINKAFRKIAFQIALNKDVSFSKISADKIEGLLGKPPFYRDIYQGNDYAGVVTGLAWTSVGGEILFIETSLSKGKGSKLTLTGNLGDVMKESAVIALEYIKAHVDILKIDYRLFDQWNIHIHVPEGATPKDGPSAGITIATSIASALTQRKVRKNTAMTGEITLRGKVLPVGGIKEKILAAKRAGITDIVICKDNKKDIDEIPAMYLNGIEFHYVENIQDVWKFALTNEKVKHPIKLDIEEEEKDK